MKSLPWSYPSSLKNRRKMTHTLPANSREAMPSSQEAEPGDFQ